MSSPPPATPARTLNELFFGAIERYRDRPAALRNKRDGRWSPMSYRELLERVQDMCAALRDLGIAPGDRVAIVSENRPEWAITDFACLAARCADVPVYPTLPGKQVDYLLRDSGAVAVCVSTRAQLDKIGEIRGGLPALRHVIAFDRGLERPGVLGFDALLARGRAARERWPAWRDEALRVTPDDLATIIYTSGTTGEPKGVMLTHGNIASNVAACLPLLPMTDRDECLSLLPLSHIFERMAGHYTMFQAGVIINYAESVEAVSANLVEIRPTICCAVPRVYEKVYARALETASTASPLKKRIFFWAKRVGGEWAERQLNGRVIPLDLKLARAAADALVFRKLRARIGGRLRYFISGGAPLSPEIARFFYSAGLVILEGYGLTETSPVISVNTPAHLKLGTVGRPLPGVQVRIAEDGEILTRGPHVMRGYYNKPDATREALTPDGWFHTGDIGELDAEGYLRITDRKKDLIVTAGGKKVAPQPIEGLLKLNKFISNAVLLGDRRKFPIALLVPNFDRLETWAREVALRWDSREELARLPEVEAHLAGEARKNLRDLAQFEVPKRFLVLPRDFSIENGELTPKLSVRRRVVEQHYADRIEAAYAEADAHGAPAQSAQGR
ncbi:MAG TPA: long-chain fatty acid--CoA ligase [Gemmatimonadales bacterium]|nr:long-chain fatty acid--CoA ligase [Gemmatimonadales bacterium]